MLLFIFWTVVVQRDNRFIALRVRNTTTIPAILPEGFR